MTAFANVTIHHVFVRDSKTVHSTTHRCVSPVEARHVVADYIRAHGLRRVLDTPNDYSRGALVNGDVVVGRYSIAPRR